MRNAIVWLLLYCFSLSVLAKDEPVRFCDDAAEWTPYTYFVRDKAGLPEGQVTGAMADLLPELARLVGLPFSLELVPWNRCLNDVAYYDSEKGGYEALVNGTLNGDRLKHYYATTPVYRTHLGFFYRTETPSRRKIYRTRDLNRGRICGVLGYNYSWYYRAGLAHNVDLGARDPKMALEKLAAGRCDYFISNIEVIMAAKELGLITIPPNIRGKVLADLPSPTFHILISKRSPRAFELVTKLNQALLTLEHEGVTEEIFKQYLPGGTGLENSH